MLEKSKLITVNQATKDKLLARLHNLIQDSSMKTNEILINAKNLYEEAKHLFPPSEQVEFLDLIARCLLQMSRFGEALEFSTQAMKFQRKNGMTNLQAGLILKTHGTILHGLDRSRESILFLHKALEIFLMHHDKFQEMNARLLIGQCYTSINSSKEAIDSLLKAQLLAEQFKDKLSLARIYLNLGNTYSEYRDLDKASEYYLKCSKLALKIGKMTIYAGAINNLCLVYTMRGEQELALKSMLESLEIFEKHNNTGEIPASLSNIGMMQIKLGLYEEALLTLKKATGYLSKSNNPGLYIRILLNTAMCYHLSGNQEEALKYLVDASALADEIHSLDMKCAALELSYLISKEQGQFEQALEFHDQMLETLRDIWAKEKEESVKQVEDDFLLIRNKQKAEIYKLKNVNLKKKNKQISEQKAKLEKAMTALQQANQTKNKLFSIIAHDLRGPLGSLYQGLELVNDAEFKPDSKQDFVNELTNSAFQAYRMTDNLLYWASQQMELITNHPKPVHLDEMVHDIVEHHASLAKIKNITVVQDIHVDLPALVDSNIFSIVLRNLLSNALKFTPMNGTISVKIFHQNGKYTCQITDTGEGMTKAVVNMLFKHERDFIKEGTNFEKGVGLGLMLCKEFTGIMGGKLSVQSTVGKGSTFSFDVPMAERSL